MNLDKVNIFEHLGHYVGQNALNNSVSNCISRFQTEVNLLMAQFGTAFPDTRYKLFKTYCMPIYGCQLWDFSKREVERFSTAWRKAIRFLWRLPYRTHNVLLPIICRDLSVETQLNKRFVKFFHKILHTENNFVYIHVDFWHMEVAVLLSATP